MSDNKFIDNVVLRLQRKYKKDELVAHLNKRLKESEFKNGVLQSELDEIDFNKKSYNQLVSRCSKLQIQVENLKNADEKKSSLKRKIKELQDYVRHLESKIY